MPWVGGIFSRTNGVNSGPTLWAQDQAQGFNIITSHHDTNDQDIATGLQNCVTVDGLNKLAASFIPAADATYNIGSTTVRFQNEYLSGSLFLYNGNTNSIQLVADTLTGSHAITIPDVAGAMVVTVATQTLANKTLGPEGTSAGNGGAIRFAELAANGTNVVGFKAPDTIASDVAWTLPAADGTAGQAMTTDGSTNLSWTNLAPPGALMAFAGTSAPTGWHLCDGSAISRATFVALFAAIGTTWGIGDGTTTFNVPDYRGRSVIGAGTGSGLSARTVGQTGGAESVTSGGTSLSVANLPSHTHGFSGTTATPNAPHEHSYVVPDASTSGPFAAGSACGGTTSLATGTDSPSHTHTYSGTTNGGSGTGTAHTHTVATMSPFGVALMIIKT